MSTNKFFLLVGATLVAGLLSVLSAVADVPHPQADSLRAYQSLTAVELRAARQPKFQHGLSDLSRNESRYQERLPVQLGAAIKKISARKYQPSRR